jgi:hypothetical protein
MIQKIKRRYCRHPVEIVQAVCTTRGKVQEIADRFGLTAAQVRYIRAKEKRVEKSTTGVDELEAEVGRLLPGSGCKWPIGEPKARDFHYCGKVRILGKPYCEYHCSIAYNKVATRRRKVV